MTIESYVSSLSIGGLGACIGAASWFYTQNKNVGAIFIVVGFIIATVSHFLVNYCIKGFFIGLDISELSISCHLAVPYFSFLGFLLVGVGILLHANAIRKNA